MSEGDCRRQFFRGELTSYCDDYWMAAFQSRNPNEEMLVQVRARWRWLAWMKAKRHYPLLRMVNLIGGK